MSAVVDLGIVLLSVPAILANLRLARIERMLRRADRGSAIAIAAASDEPIRTTADDA